ncbi:MAG: hypothetical protein Q8N77_01985 [Nanoarchaeota archaeon]|nr:hypothetical protein [Nanoarchaeota archaeon]
MKNIARKILAGLSAFAFLSTAPMALNAYNMDEPKLVVQSKKRDLHINFSKDGSKFVYTRLDDNSRNSVSEIVSNEKGTEKVIVSQGFFDAHPSFSPDGKKIAFFRGLGMGYGVICTVDSDGKNLEDLANARISKVSWSPDGKELTYISGYVEEKINTLTEEDVKNLNKMKNNPWRLKPGDKVKIPVEYGAVMLLNLETKDVKYLTTNEGNCECPRFMDDGKIIYVFNKSMMTSAGKEIWMMDKDGSNKLLLVQPENYEKKTQDGNSVIVHVKEGSAYQVSVDKGMMAYMLTTTERIAKATPDGKKFKVEELKDESNSAIYVRNLKTGETKMVTDEGLLWFPEIKDNKVYFSRYEDDTEHDIYSIDLK